MAIKRFLKLLGVIKEFRRGTSRFLKNLGLIKGFVRRLTTSEDFGRELEYIYK